MKAKIIVWVIIVIFIAAAYFSGQYYWLTKTDKLPYRNLTHIGSGSCYIIFNVKNRDTVYTVVMPNLNASELVRENNRFSGFVYSLYMNETIAHNFSIRVDDSLFSSISHCIVDPKAVAKFQGRDIRNDTTIFGVKNSLRYDINQSDFNAIIYLFMKSGSNCCVEDYSGATTVSSKFFRNPKTDE
jgi:hypothetical protein